MHDLVKQIGVRGFATRLKRIADAMSHSVRAMYRTLEMDIEPNWYLVLILVKNKEAISVVEIAKSMGFTHQSVNNITNKMVKKGYLIQSKNLRDKRKTVFKLTEKANRELPKVNEIWDIGEEVLMEILNHQAEILQQLEIAEQNLIKSSFGERILEKLNNLKNE